VTEARVQSQHRYDRLRQEGEPATGGHYYEDLRRTHHRVDDAQKANDAQREKENAAKHAAEAQNRLREPNFGSPQEAYDARRAALSEILNERLAAGKINSSEASRAMFSFECDGSLKYRNEVIGRMWHHRDLQEMREIAAEVRGLETQRSKEQEMER
jgi:hypothetical protein